MTISKQDQKNIGELIRDDRFQSVLSLAAIMIDRYRQEDAWGITSFETIKKLGYREGKIAGIESFMKILEESAL